MGFSFDIKIFFYDLVDQLVFYFVFLYIILVLINGISDKNGRVLGLVKEMFYDKEK